MFSSLPTPLSSQQLSVQTVVTTLDVFVSEPPLIESRVFELWLSGFPPDKAARVLLSPFPNCSPSVFSPGATNQVPNVHSFNSSSSSSAVAPIVSTVQPPSSNNSSSNTTSIASNSPQLTSQHASMMMHVITQYRNFNTLKTLFHNPKLLMNVSNMALLLQWPPIVRRSLLNRYYTFDDVVLRELFGKKLSVKVRKDLDDVSERTNVDLVSCRRQFDNLNEVTRRVGKYIVHQVHQRKKSQKVDAYSLTSLVQKDFFLDEQLARKYAVAVLMSYYRLDTHKKRMKDLTFEECYEIGNSVLRYWTTSCTNPLKFSLDFIVLKDIKNLLFGDRDTRLNEWRALVKENMKKNMSGPSTIMVIGIDDVESKQTVSPLTTQEINAIDARFVSMVKMAIQIGAGLQQPKELRDLLVDLQDKVVDFWLSKVKVHHTRCRLFWERTIECCTNVRDISAVEAHTEHLCQFLRVVRDATAVMLEARCKK